MKEQAPPEDASQDALEDPQEDPSQRPTPGWVFHPLTPDDDVGHVERRRMQDAIALAAAAIGAALIVVAVLVL